MEANELNLVNLVLDLAALSDETEWVEFKVNNKDPEKIGECISGLANSAALLRKDHAYMVWGIVDKPHDIVGTKFKPRQTKVSGQDLEHFLATQLEPRANLAFHEVLVDGRAVVLLEIESARYAPVSFRGQRWIRIASHNKPLRHFPEKERALWASFGRASFENGIAKSGLAGC